MAETQIQDGAAAELADFFDEACIAKGVTNPNVLTVAAEQSVDDESTVIISADVNPTDQEQVKVAGALIRALHASGRIAAGDIRIPTPDEYPSGFMAFVDKDTFPQLSRAIPVRPLGSISLQ